MQSGRLEDSGESRRPGVLALWYQATSGSPRVCAGRLKELTNGQGPHMAKTEGRSSREAEAQMSLSFAFFFGKLVAWCHTRPD